MLFHLLNYNGPTFEAIFPIILHWTTQVLTYSRNNVEKLQVLRSQKLYCSLAHSPCYCAELEANNGDESVQ